MYPFVTISWAHIEITGLGIILAFLTFILVCRFRTQTMLISFSKLYYALPGMIALIYSSGSYVSFVLSTGNLFPSSLREFHHIFLPESYQFHAGGMIIGMLIFLILFVNQQPWRLVRYKRIDCIFVGSMHAMIVLWIFLVIGDDMIGKSTESRIGIYALTPVSEVAKFNKVYPVGLFLSCAALISYLASYIFKRHSSWPGWWFGWFWVFLLLLSIVLLYQHYPRHGVIMLGGIRYDINQYICWLLWILCLLRYTRISGISYKKMSQRIIHIIKS